MGIENAFYFIVFIIVAYIMTTTKYTSSVRILLYLMLSLNFAIERIIIRSSPTNYGNDNEIIHNKIWFFRKVFLIIAFIILISSIWLHKDYQVLNYNKTLELGNKIEKIEQIVVEKKDKKKLKFEFHRLNY